MSVAETDKTGQLSDLLGSVKFHCRRNILVIDLS